MTLSVYDTSSGRAVRKYDAPQNLRDAIVWASKKLGDGTLIVWGCFERPAAAYRLVELYDPADLRRAGDWLKADPAYVVDIQGCPVRLGVPVGLALSVADLLETIGDPERFGSTAVPQAARFAKLLREAAR